jgi:hypothetical protein
MKGVILAAFVVVAATAGIASLASGASIFINAIAIQTHATPRVAMGAR